MSMVELHFSGKDDPNIGNIGLVTCLPALLVVVGYKWVNYA